MRLILTGPSESADYFKAFDRQNTLGQEAQDLYEIIIDDPVKAAQLMKKSTIPQKYRRFLSI